MQSTPTKQTPSLYRHRVGDIVVTAILDGSLAGAFSYFQGIPEEAMAREMQAAFRPGPPVLSVSCHLIHTGGRVILVDSGSGASEMFDGGRLHAGLNAAGVSPDSIDTVVLTHIHIDHAGGITTADGRAVFRNAELILHEDEKRFWLDGTARAGMEPYFDAARAALAPYAKAMRTVGGGEVAPGVSLVHLPGHTPGHCGVRVASGREQLVLWTDIVHAPPLQCRHPDVTIAFDLDPEQAREQRRRLFDEVATDRLLVAGPHMDFPTFGQLERHSDGYRFVPRQWLPQL